MIPFGGLSTPLSAQSFLQASSSVWRSTGPSGGPVLCVVASGLSTAYAGTRYGGVFKSTDGGATWANSGLKGLIVQAITIDPHNSSVLYASVTGSASSDAGGLFKSLNGGGSWQLLTGLPARGFALAIDPSSSSTLYAGGLFKSQDAGRTWQQAAPGLGLEASVHSIIVDPRASAILYAATDSGVYKSSNGGNNWDPSNAGLSVNGSVAPIVSSIVVDSQGSAVLYAGAYPGVFKSVDDGRHWTDASQGLVKNPSFNLTNIDALIADPNAPSVLYAGSEGSGLFVTRDGGSSWASVPTPNDDYVLSLALDGAGRVYLANFNGVASTDESRTTWNEANKGLVFMGMRALAADASRHVVYAAALAGIGENLVSVFRSLDNARSWQEAGNGLDAATFMTAVAMDSQYTTLYGSDQRGRIWKSTDGASTWRRQGSISAPFVDQLAVDPVKPSVLFALSEPMLYRSVNGGVTWMPVAIAESTTSVLGFAFGTGGTLYVRASGPGGEGFVYKSFDAGDSWISSDSGLGRGVVSAMAVGPDSDATVYALLDGIGLYSTRDGGATWRFVNSQPLPLTSLVVDPSGDTLYASDGAQVYASTSRDIVWVPLAAGLDVLWTRDLKIFGDELFAATSEGIYQVGVDPGTQARRILVPPGRHGTSRVIHHR